MPINLNLLNESLLNAKNDLKIRSRERTDSQQRRAVNDELIKTLVSNLWDTSDLGQHSEIIERVTVTFLTTMLVDRLYNGPVITDFSAFKIDLGEILRKFIERITKY